MKDLDFLKTFAQNTKFGTSSLSRQLKQFTNHIHALTVLAKSDWLVAGYFVKFAEKRICVDLYLKMNANYKKFYLFWH